MSILPIVMGIFPVAAGRILCNSPKYRNGMAHRTAQRRNSDRFAAVALDAAGPLWYDERSLQRGRDGTVVAGETVSSFGSKRTTARGLHPERNKIKILLRSQWYLRSGRNL